MSKILKAVLILVIIVAIGFFAYKYFLKPGAKTPLSGLVSGGNATVSPSQNIDSEFLQTLLSLKAIRLDTSVFESSSYKSLKDYTVVLPEVNDAGRPNPFAPVGATASR